MKQSLLISGLLVGLGTIAGTTAKAQFTYTPGDVVIYRVGDGTAALSNAGASVFLDEYNPLTGVLVGSENLTTSGTLPLVASGTAGSEGLLSLSGNGQYLVATGYDQAPGTASVSSSTSANVPREAATIGSTGAVVQTTINNYSGNNIRSAASVDGTTIYTSGATTGILQVVSGATNTTGTVISASTNVSGTPTALTNTRALTISNGQLLLSTGSGTTRLDSLGSAPAAGTVSQPLPGISSSNITAPYQFVAATLTAGGTTTDTVYVADNGSSTVGGTIEKFSLVGGTFTLTGTIALPGVDGLTGQLVNGVEQLFATTETTTGQTVVPGLYSLTDATGAGGTLTGTATELVAAGTNEAFRGLAFAPSLTPVPEPSTCGMLLLAGCGTWLVIRRSRKIAA